MEKENRLSSSEKELLLKELSARLPYDVKCRDFVNEVDITVKGISALYSDDNPAIVSDFGSEDTYLVNIRPYLRSMSNMTVDEEAELDHIAATCESYPISETGFKLADFISDFCNRHHLDYRGLIPKELAIEAPENMYEFQKEE